MLIKKNGLMFVATINKNLKSYLYAILGAEYILRWLPIGTHDWDKFLTPRELEIIATRNNFTNDEVVGMKFDLLSKKWRECTDVSINYISTFSKNQFSELFTQGIVATSMPSSSNSAVSSGVVLPYMPFEVFLS